MTKIERLYKYILVQWKTGGNFGVKLMSTFNDTIRFYELFYERVDFSMEFDPIYVVFISIHPSADRRYNDQGKTNEELVKDKIIRTDGKVASLLGRRDASKGGRKNDARGLTMGIIGLYVIQYLWA